MNSIFKNNMIEMIALVISYYLVVEPMIKCWWQPPCNHKMLKKAMPVEKNIVPFITVAGGCCFVSPATELTCTFQQCLVVDDIQSGL